MISKVCIFYLYLHYNFFLNIINTVQLFFYSQITNGQLALICIYLNESQQDVNLVVKCESPYLINHIISSIRYLLMNEN